MTCAGRKRASIEAKLRQAEALNKNTVYTDSETEADESAYAAAFAAATSNGACTSPSPAASSTSVAAAAAEATDGDASDAEAEVLAEVQVQEQLISQVRWLQSDDEAPAQQSASESTDAYDSWLSPDEPATWPSQDAAAVSSGEPEPQHHDTIEQPACAEAPAQWQDDAQWQQQDAVGHAEIWQRNEPQHIADSSSSEFDQHAAGASEQHSTEQQAQQGEPSTAAHDGPAGDEPPPKISSLDIDPDGSSSSSAPEDSSSDDAAEAFRQAVQDSDWGHWETSAEQHAGSSDSGDQAQGTHEDEGTQHLADVSDWSGSSTDDLQAWAGSSSSSAEHADSFSDDADSGTDSSWRETDNAQSAPHLHPDSAASTSGSDVDNGASVSSSDDSASGSEWAPAAPLPMPKSRAQVQRELAEKELEQPSQFLQALRATFDADATSHPVPQQRVQRAQSRRARTRHSVVFVAAEAAPYSKTGGLGDVLASLPCALAERGHRVMVITPRYIVDDRTEALAAQLHDCNAWTKTELSGADQWVNFHHEHRCGVDWVYVQHDVYERRGGLYGSDAGIYEDNQFRCARCSHFNARLCSLGAQAPLVAHRACACEQLASIDVWVRLPFDMWMLAAHDCIIASGQCVAVLAGMRCSALLRWKPRSI